METLPTSRKIVSIESAAQKTAECSGTVVWTNGCFDLLHIGHLHSLSSAAFLGDVLMVGVNSDQSIRQLKGESRPIVPCAERMEIIAALEYVDWVVCFDELTPRSALETIKPDIHCKGSDYADGTKPIPERGVVEAYGGVVHFLPFVPGLSTTNRINAIVSAAGLIDGRA